MRVWIKRSLLAAVSFATISAAQAETLTDAFILAYQNSNLLEQNRALLRAADEDVVVARSSLLPVIQFVTTSAFTSPALSSGVKVDNWNTTHKLSMSLTLFDNGQSRYAIDAAKETILGLRSALLQLEQRVLLNTVTSYMEVIRAAQAVSLGQSNVRVITQELRAARDRFEVGEVTRTDVAIAEARLAAARGNLASAVGDLEIGREAYMAAVGRAPGNLRWPSAPPIVAKTELAAKALAERNHPSIDEAQHDVNVAEANIKRAKAAMGPSVTSSAALNLDDSFESSFSGSLQLNVPIYQGGRLRALARQAAARRDAARAALLQSVVLVRQDVGTAWARLQVAAARTEASRRQVSASQVAYNGVREEAKLGSRTTLDVLNAEQELLDARTSLITAEVQQYVSVYTLLSAMGLLTSEHLKLGIVTYDPVEYYNYSSTQAPISMRGSRLDKVLRSLGKQ